MFPEWHRRARCINANDQQQAWFFSDETRTQRLAVRAFCNRCPVIDQCLAAGLAQETLAHRFGVWGGLTSRDRRHRMLPAGTTATHNHRLVTNAR